MEPQPFLKAARSCESKPEILGALSVSHFRQLDVWLEVHIDRCLSGTTLPYETGFCGPFMDGSHLSPFLCPNSRKKNHAFSLTYHKMYLGFICTFKTQS